MRRCTTHHHACDCREQNYKEAIRSLKNIESLLDAARLGRSMTEEHKRIKRIIKESGYDL